MTQTNTSWLRLAKYIRQNTKLIYLLIIILTIIMAAAATTIKVDNSIPVWQTEGDINWLHFKEFKQKHQLRDPLVALFPNLPYANLKQLSRNFEQIPGVDRTLPFNIYTLQQQESGVILLFPDLNCPPQTLDAIINRIEQDLSQTPQVKYYLGGVWYLTAVLDKLSSRSSATLFPLVLSLMALGVWLVFRNIKTTLLVLCCGVLPAIWLTGIMALLNEKMNMVLLALPPLTMILGISHAIHFLLKDNRNNQEPLLTFSQTLPPCTLSALTTTLGFLSLCFSSYAPVQNLGKWGAVGVCLSLTITILLLPARYPVQSKSCDNQIWHKLTDLLRHNPRQIYTLCLLFAVIAFGMVNLSRGSFILDFLEKNSTARINHLSIEDAGIGLTPLEVELQGVDLPDNRLSEIITELAKQEIVTHFLFFFGNNPYNFKAIPTKNGAEFDAPLLPGQANGKISRLTVLTRTISSEETMAFADFLEDFMQQHLGSRKTPYVTGTVPLFTKGQDQLFNTLINSFSLAFISISLLIGLMLRSVKLGLLAIIPNLLPVVLVIGVMGWISIPLSVATVTVASIVFGVVVDDTIHFLHAWQQQKNNSDRVLRLRATLAKVGPAMLCTTLAAGGSFLGFWASPFVPLRNFGLLISLALALAIICDLVLLPMLLLMKRERE